jgi:predicted nuclease of predicted toxin-antitoxin system
MPKRKINVLCDENMEQALLRALCTLRYFRVHTMPRRSDDQAVWREARRRKAAILTSDTGDFWNDRKYPIHLSPAVIVLRGNTAREKMLSPARVMIDWDLVTSVQRAPTLLEHRKIRASSMGTEAKYWNGEALVHERT